MTKTLYLLLAFVLTLFACKNKQGKSGQHIYKPCVDGHDTTFHLSFAKDTSTKDFYQMLDFIESKGEFSRFDKKNKIDSSTDDRILLQKVLCEDKGFDTPIENWLLDNIFSIRYCMTSRKPLKGEPNYYPRLDITQFNFQTESEKNIALSKIKEIGWGDPLKKWNDYFIISSTTRIIVLESGAAIFSETKNRYGKMIQKEWADKNSH